MIFQKLPNTGKETSKMGGRPLPLLPLRAALADGVMCAIMNALQWKIRGLTCTAEEVEAYLNQCGDLAREDYYAVPEPLDFEEESARQWSWASPLSCGFERNSRFRVEVFPVAGNPSAPSVILLHALMSASSKGYHKLARQLNEAGWAVLFPHLPFHYSRVPGGFVNGSLAVSANLIRNGETIRQSVMEIRQLLTLLRLRGVQEFGLIGTSYGGWVGSLVSFLEPDFRFLALLQPIADTDHAIWENPGAASIRRILSLRGVSRLAASRHAHLSSPMHGRPRLDPSRVVICAASHDRVSPPRVLQNLSRQWGGAHYLEVPQGHFGYAAMPVVLDTIRPWLDLSTK